MSDYIGRQAAVDAVKSVLINHIPTLLPRYEDIPLECARAIMRIPPAADVIEIVKCKDCIYYRRKIDMCDEPYSTAHNVVHEDDYCSRAERSADE